jgi:DNA-directed RNA polymerase
MSEAQALDYGSWQLQLDTSNRKQAKLDATIRQQRLAKLNLLSKSEHGQVIFQRCAEAVRQAICEVGSLAKAGRPGPYYSAIQWILQMEDPGQVAALALQAVIDSISRETHWPILVNRIGAFCETEARAGRLRTINPNLCRAITCSFKGRGITYSFNDKRLSEYGIAAAPWGPKGRATVGAFLLDRVIESTGIVHTNWRTDINKKKYLCVSPAPEVLEFLKQLPPSATQIRSSICVTPPTPWDSTNIDTYSIGSVDGGLVRLPGYCAGQRDELTLSWLPPGAADRLMAAANHLQSCAFTFDQELTQLASRLWSSERRDIDTLFPCPRIPAVIPPMLEKDATDDAWKQRNRQAALGYQDHRTNGPIRVAISRAISIADRFASHPIHFPASADYRSRLYAGGEISYQGSPMVRALVGFHPATAEPLTADGLDWCLRTAGSTFLGRKTTFEQRLQWGQNNIDRIRAVAADPWEHTDLWLDAADTWRHVAACQAIARHLDKPGTPIGLPIYFDQSCSGLGHIAALVRDLDSGMKTKLLPDPDSQLDLYQTIAAQLAHLVQLDLHEPGLTKDGNPNLRKQRRAAFWAKQGISRAIIKECIIAWPYGVKLWGVRTLVSDKLIRLVDTKNPRDLVEKVDGPALYLASLIVNSIASYLPASNALKGWLRSCASTIAKTNQPLQFTTPTGFVVRDAELTTSLCTFNTVLNGRKFPYHHISSDKKSKINSAKIAGRITANYIHSMDASLCINVVNTFVGLGLPMATVHDCFATTPNHAGRLHATLLSSIRELHQTEWLARLHEEWQASYDLGLPPPPMVGTLDPGLIGSDDLLFS